jgi:proteic killer suppression protein
MIVSFFDQVTSDIFNGIESKQARKRLPVELWKSAIRKLDQIDSVIVLDELRVPPGNRLEKLHGSRDDQLSIRINNQYRICFTWSDAGAVNVEITDYHS